MSQTSKTQTTLYYSSKRHLGERVSIVSSKNIMADVIKKRIEARIMRREWEKQTFIKCSELIEKIFIQTTIKSVNKRIAIA